MKNLSNGQVEQLSLCIWNTPSREIKFLFELEYFGLFQNRKIEFSVFRNGKRKTLIKMKTFDSQIKFF